MADLRRALDQRGSDESAEIEATADHDRCRHPGREPGALADRRPRRPGPPAGLLPDRADGQLQPRADPRAPAARKGGRGLRHLRGEPRRQSLHESGRLPARHRNRARPSLLDRRRRARLARHLARPPRLCRQVLHERGKSRHRRQQHPGLFHPRPDQVPELHPQPEAAGRQQPARPRHAVGLLDPFARVGPSGHLADGGPGHPEELAAHERVLVAHLHVGQREERAVLGQVPLQDRPGHRVPHPGRGGPHRRAGRGLPPAGPLRGASTGGSSRAGRSRCRSCPSRRPRPTASTRST